LEEETRRLRGELEKATLEAKDLNHQLVEEQRKTASISKELGESSYSRREAAETAEKVRDLQRENAILKESNSKLLDSAYDTERERQFQASEAALKLQVITN